MEEVPSSCTAVVAVGAELTTALAVNEAVRRDGKPFVFCDIFEDEVVIFGDGGASEDEVVGGGFCRADSTEVCIGTVSGGEGGVVVVTCNRSHGLEVREHTIERRRIESQSFMCRRGTESGVSILVTKVTAGRRMAAACSPW